MRGGTGGHKRLRDGGGGGRGAGGKLWYGRGLKRGMAGADRETMEATETMASAASRRRRTTKDPPVSTQNNGARESTAWAVTERKRAQMKDPSGEERRRKS